MQGEIHRSTLERETDPKRLAATCGSQTVLAENLIRPTTDIDRACNISGVLRKTVLPRPALEGVSG